MPANYELWYTDDDGKRLALLDTTAGFEYVLVDGDLGWLAVVMPARQSAIYNTIRPDNQIHLYRQPPHQALALELVAFTRRWAFDTTPRGLTSLRMSGPDTNELLARRIVAFAATTSQAAKTDYADDMMKEVVDENLGPATPATARRYPITIQSDLSAGTSITKAFSWQNVLTTLQGIQASSKTDGTEVFFAMKPLSPTAFQFQTHTGQPGADRTISTGNKPLVFGLSRGNLVNPFYEEDYSTEASYAYAGGQGLEEERNVQEAEVTARTNRSKWGRIETFTPSNSKVDAAIAAAANDRLARMRPKIRFSAQLLSTPETPYGAGGWRHGDKVTCDHLGRQFDAIIKQVHNRVGGDRSEIIVANAEFVA